MFSSASESSVARNIMKRNSKKQVNRTVALRGLFAVSMMVAIAVCATVAFVMIRNLQDQIGVKTIER